MRQLTFPGEALQQRRLELGLTLKQVQEEIRVPLQYIEALERGDMSALPAPTYTVGFLATYCECLGLAPAPYLDRYRTLCDEPASRPERAQVTAVKAPVFALPALPAHRPVWLADAMAWGTICGILLLGWVTYSVVFKPAAQDETRIEAGTFDAPPPPAYHFLEDELAAPQAQ